MPWLGSKPSSSTRSWFSVCSFSSWPPAIGPRPRARPERVELVDEDDAGRHLARLLEQVAHPRGADADEHLDELGAEIEKKGTPASPATARASRVLPVPGGPTSSTPRGRRAPSAP